jgi:hypothetical protein
MADDPTSAPITSQLLFHYIKTADYREIPCHGAIGNLTPNGKIWVALYSERTPLPRAVGYQIPVSTDGSPVKFDEGAAGPPTFIDSREGIVRNVEVSAYLDIDVAERLNKWLSDRIEAHKKLSGGIKP